jgi:hypothetical protein
MILNIDDDDDDDVVVMVGWGKMIKKIKSISFHMVIGNKHTYFCVKDCI